MVIVRSIMSLKNSNESNPRLYGSAVPQASAPPRVAYNTRRCSYPSVPCDGPVVRTVTWTAGKVVVKQSTERREA